jgi:hypothetical protein
MVYAQMAESLLIQREYQHNSYQQATTPTSECSLRPTVGKPHHARRKLTC